MSPTPERRHRSEEQHRLGHHRLGVVDAPASDQELSYGDLFRLLWRRKWSFTLIVVLCLGVAIAYLRHATPLYLSSARLCLEPGSKGLLTEGNAARPQNYLYVQSELMRSPTILSDALSRLGAVQPTGMTSTSKPVNVLRDGLKIDVDKDDDSMTIGYESPSPDEAARIVSVVVDSYTDYQANQARTAAREVADVLTKEKESWDSKRTDQLQAMAAYRSAHSDMSFENKNGNIITEKLAALSKALTDAQMEAAQLAALDQRAAKKDDNANELVALLESTDNLDLLASPTLKDIDKKLTEKTQNSQILEEKLRSQKAALGSAHPDVKETQGLVDSLKTEIPVLEQRKAICLREIIHDKAESAKQAEQLFQEKYSTQEKLAEGLNEKQSVYFNMQADLERIEKLSDMLDTRIKGIDVSRDLAAVKVTVLQPPEPADAPAEPQKTRTLAVALAIGLVLGFACALTMDWADQRLWEAKDIRTRLRLPVLGVVPHVKGPRRISVIGRVVEDEPMSQFSEACRALRTAVFYGMMEGRPKRLLVTSPGPGEGKSVTAANLAIAMGQAGSRTLLIDADFRKPSLHEIFSMDNETGLSSVLAGHQGLSEVIQPSTVEGLDILTAGPIPLNPSEMLNSQPFENALNKLAEQYDQIVVDSPPVTLVTDPCVLAAMCDATVLVFRAASSTRRDAEEAVESLQSLGANLIGGIINDMPTAAARYGYGYGYPATRTGRRSRSASGVLPKPSSRAIVVARRRR